MLCVCVFSNGRACISEMLSIQYRCHFPMYYLNLSCEKKGKLSKLQNYHGGKIGSGNSVFIISKLSSFSWNDLVLPCRNQPIGIYF